MFNSRGNERKAGDPGAKIPIPHRTPRSNLIVATHLTLLK
jgi:hypothetical protein